MSGTSQPILYSYWRSSCSWRVRIALKFKEIPHELKPVDLMKDEQHRKEYERINPMKKVPALHIDGHTLIDSLNILHYLEETRPKKPLLPDDAQKRARVREICQIIVAEIQPLQNLAVLNYIGKDKETWSRHWITQGFEALEKLLSTTAGKYCVGDEITLADCCVIPQVYNARRFKLELKPYPLIQRIDKELENHPAFADTHPSRQLDCPSEFANK